MSSKRSVISSNCSSCRLCNSTSQVSNVTFCAIFSTAAEQFFSELYIRFC